MTTKRFFQMTALMLGMVMTSVMMTSCSAEDNPVDVPGDVPSVGQGQKQEGNWTYSDYGTYTLINAYTGSDKATLKTLNFPVYLGGKKVMGIAWNFKFNEFTSLETLNFYDYPYVDEMPSVMGCSKLAHINVIKDDGTIKDADALPACIRTIPSNCFRGTAIEGIYMPEVISVHAGAFRDCKNLQIIHLRRPSIEEGAFSYIPSSCVINTVFYTWLEDWTWQMIAFSPNLYVSCAKGCAIGWCGDGDVTAQDFLYWKLDEKGELTIACGGDGWFNFQDKQIIKTHRWNDTGKAVYSITLSDVYAIGDEEFKGMTSVGSVTLNEGLTSIGASAFEDCTDLTSITIPASVKSIGANAFKGCTKMTKVTIMGNPTIGDGAFRYGVTVTYGNE